MKEEKEIIDYIVDKLKKSEGLPYRTGAWEKFRSEHGTPGASLYRMSRAWYAAASIVLLLGIGGVWYMAREVEDSEKKLVQTTLPQNSVHSLEKKPVLEENPDIFLNEGSATKDQTTVLPVYATTAAAAESQSTTIPDPLDDESELQVSAEVHIPAMLPLQGRDLSYDTSILNVRIEEKISGGSMYKHLTSSSMQQGMILAMKEVEGQNQFQRVHLNDRFQLGLFVSPYATSQKMNVGGGFSLAYKLNNKFSVRTGASYNNYEVNMLKDPVREESSMEVVVAEEKSSMKMQSISSTAYQNKVIIPNINAIKGFVQSIDVPVELKFNVDKSFYAAAGVSYSAILHQERNAYYVENVNKETFSDGYPENKQQAEQAVKPVTKAVESTENNVNTNGFSGFVHFSIGKEVKMNKSMGISVEPYLKIPVGQYRRADMDYTNGGIRIITSF